jgi:Histidine kinase-like ATPase domain
MRDVNPLDLVETTREGILVLEADLTIRFAGRSFYDTFVVASEQTVGRKVYEIGNGQWDIPQLHTSFETIISGRKTIEAFEVEHFFPVNRPTHNDAQRAQGLLAPQQDTTDPPKDIAYLELCRDLIASVHKDGDRSIVLKTEIESELLPTDRAIPIGLIVNELVTNAIKYAFAGEAKGTVKVALKRAHGELRLTVAEEAQRSTCRCLKAQWHAFRPARPDMRQHPQGVGCSRRETLAFVGLWKRRRDLGRREQYRVCRGRQSNRANYREFER